MESVEESISALRLKIEETKKIRRRQETELFELTIVLADIHKKAREANRDCFERIQAAEQQKTRQRLEAAIRQETKQRQEAARKQKRIAKERHRRLLLDTVQTLLFFICSSLFFICSSYQTLCLSWIIVSGNKILRKKNNVTSMHRLGWTMNMWCLQNTFFWGRRRTRRLRSSSPTVSTAITDYLQQTTFSHPIIGNRHGAS